MKPVTKLQKALTNGQTVLIEFVKNDGTIRRARVTKNLSNIPAHKHPKEGKSNRKVIVFFDVRKQDWICCYPDKINFVKTPDTPAQLRRKREAAERWATVKRIIDNYNFTIGEALKLADGKKVWGVYLENLRF